MSSTQHRTTESASGEQAVQLMNIASKTTKSGLEFPVLGLGTWQMGGREFPDPNTDESRVHRIIRAAIDMGITHIDTAELYAAGYTESLVGDVVKGVDRSNLMIVSKWSPLMSNDPVTSCEASLKRLQTDYLDAYLIHRNPVEPSLGQTMDAMNRLVERGLVRHLGVCNMSSSRQAETQALSNTALVCNQVHYNLTFREPEVDGLIDHNIDTGSVVSAWRPMQYGELATGESTALQQMCEKYGATPAQIAISWLTSQRGVVTIVKTMDEDHLAQNIEASQIIMDSQDIEILRSDFPGKQTISNRIPLDT